jgi:hypothetical protein
VYVRTIRMAFLCKGNPNIRHLIQTSAILLHYNLREVHSTFQCLTWLNRMRIGKPLKAHDADLKVPQGGDI